MINNSVEVEKKEQFLIKHRRLFAAAILIALVFSFVWKNQYSPNSETSLSGQNFSNSEDKLFGVLPIFLLNRSNVAKEDFLISQLPDINQAFIERPSQVPGWLVNTVKQQVQPSPKRIIDVAIDDETNDTLVVRDRVVVIPKILHVPKTTPGVKINRIEKSQNNAVNKQFTIQLLASFRRDDILRFVNSHKLNKDVKIRLTKRNDENWYVLTLGEFNQLEKAQAAIKNLPPGLGKYNPWIRSVEQLRSQG